MNPSAKPQTSRSRDRAVARVGSITTQTAIVACVATVGFGGLAAFTYSGTPGVTSIDQTSNSVDGTTNDTTNGSTSNDTTSSGSTNGLRPAPAPTASTRHKSHVTTGGSG